MLVEEILKILEVSPLEIKVFKYLQENGYGSVSKKQKAMSLPQKEVSHAVANLMKINFLEVKKKNVQKKISNYNFLP